MDHIITQEGRIKRIDELTFGYECFIKDHLGSVRVCFTENTSTNSPEVLQTNDYYPFGMSMAPSEHDNQYKYNGKELYTDYGLDWYDYGARFYDPQIGRWHVVDPLAEKYYSWTPYHYVYCNPVYFVDIDGREGNPYIRTWKRISKQEKEFIKNFPMEAIRIYINANKADKATTEMFGKSSRNDDSDAFRHAYWQALNTSIIGPNMTKIFSDAHESEVPEDEQNEKLMDTHNNAIGIEIGANKRDASDDELKKLVIEALKNGKLVSIDENGNVVPINPQEDNTNTNENENNENNEEE